MKAPICWVIPPNSVETILLFLNASRRLVFPWSTWPMIVTIGGRGFSFSGGGRGLICVVYQKDFYSVYVERVRRREFEIHLTYFRTYWTIFWWFFEVSLAMGDGIKRCLPPQRCTTSTITLKSLISIVSRNEGWTRKLWFSEEKLPWSSDEYWSPFFIWIKQS